LTANSENILLSDILMQSGYTKTGEFRFSGICNLSTIQGYKPLPNGLSIRQTQKQDVERRAQLFGLATGGKGTTSERYENMMNSPSYRDAIDLVVQTDIEQIIAYYTIWDDPVSK
jgi:hypothetical protein